MRTRDRFDTAKLMEISKSNRINFGVYSAQRDYQSGWPQSMNPIIWSEDYLIGDATIDRQHQNIVKLINELIEERITAVDSKRFQALVMELVDYANTHLAYEENLLSKINYPQYDEHKLLHDDYIEQFSDFALETLTFESGTPERILNYLIDWWNYHILVEDMKYKPYL